MTTADAVMSTPEVPAASIGADRCRLMGTSTTLGLDTTMADRIWHGPGHPPRDGRPYRTLSHRPVRIIGSRCDLSAR